MIPFRVIRSGVLLTGLLAALATSSPAASGGFTATLSPAQKTETGLDSLTAGELTALDQLVATDRVRARQTQLPSLTDTFTLRYTEEASKAAGLDRLTPQQLAKLDKLITTAVAPPPESPSPLLPRERPRLRDDAILSEKGQRLQVHGGMSLTVGTAGGGRNFHEAGAWVSYFDPVTGLGLAISYSRYSGDLLGGYSGGGYYTGSPYRYSGARTNFTGFERAGADRYGSSDYDASLGYLVGGGSADRGFRR